MVIKSLMAAAAVAGAVALGSAGTANADPHVSVGIGIGVGDGYWDGGPGFYDGGYSDDGAYWRRRHHHRRWDDPAPDMPYRISCAEGRSVVAGSGFHGISAYSCSAPVYRYIGWKHGEQFRISVNFRGNIVGVNPVY